MTRKLLLILCFSPLYFLSYSQTGCPGCITTLPDSLAVDTIFLSAAPEGQAGVYYEGDLSFRLPKSTSSVSALDSTILPGLGISKITISGVTNVPPGLSWEASQMEFNTGDDETDGCIRFCGTPLQPGLYLVDVIITARVIVVEQNASVTVPILILPAGSTTDGFNMENNSGCGNVTVGFQNNVPSNGQAGFSYNWDFGNGATSTAEDPGDQLYDLPGVYPVQYQALVDTTGYFLTKVNVNTVGCNDALGGRPDLKINIFDPAGELIHVSPIVNNAQPPISYELNIPLDTGTYLISVVDDDSGLGGADDQCGIVTFNRNTSGNLSDGDLALNLQILHPVDTITSTDTVFVFDQPDAPIITQVDATPICAGDTVLLISNFADNIQWYRDSTPILTGINDSLLVTQNGQYWVVYTSPDGCISTSDPATLSFGELPKSVLFVNENNELSLFDPSLLPTESAISWFKDGVVLEGFIETTYCIDADATYTIEVTDLSTGCSASYSQAITYDPNFPNCVSPVVNVLPDGVEAVLLFPNPTAGPLQWSIDAGESMQVVASLHTITGQRLRMENWLLTPGQQRKEWSLSDLPAGMYMVRIAAAGQGRTWRVVKY